MDNVHVQYEQIRFGLDKAVVTYSSDSLNYISQTVV